MKQNLIVFIGLLFLATFSAAKAELFNVNQCHSASDPVACCREGNGVNKCGDYNSQDGCIECGIFVTCTRDRHCASDCCFAESDGNMYCGATTLRCLGQCFADEKNKQHCINDCESKGMYPKCERIGDNDEDGTCTCTSQLPVDCTQSIDGKRAECETYNGDKYRCRRVGQNNSSNGDEISDLIKYGIIECEFPKKKNGTENKNKLHCNLFGTVFVCQLNKDKKSPTPTPTQTAQNEQPPQRPPIGGNSTTTPTVTATPVITATTTAPVMANPTSTPTVSVTTTPTTTASASSTASGTVSGNTNSINPTGSANNGTPTLTQPNGETIPLNGTLNVPPLNGSLNSPPLNGSLNGSQLNGTINSTQPAVNAPSGITNETVNSTAVNGTSNQILSPPSINTPTFGGAGNPEPPPDDPPPDIIKTN